MNVKYDIIIRFFGLLIISLFIYMKILDIDNVSKQKKISAILFSIIVSVPISLTHALIQTLILPVFVLIFVCITSKTRKGHTISSVIISVGICLGIDIISQTLLFIPMTLFSAFQMILKLKQENIIPTSDEDILKMIDIKLINMVVSIASFLVSIILVNMIFKVKRLKKGFAFLQRSENRLIGIIFSLIIFICIIYSDIRIGYLEEYYQIKPGDVSLSFFILIAINVCMLGIHFWWRHHTTVLYQLRLKDKTIEEQQVEINEKDKQINELSECNTFLSETVHRDNKLIPAMYNAVSNFLYYTDTSDEVEIKMKGTRILGELDEVIQERKNIILKIQREYKSLPSTEVEWIDNILDYMCLRASENEIQFDFTTSGNIKNIADSVIQKQKLQTLIAELIENAIIAVSYNTCKKILVTMEVVNNFYEINVHDSGISFEADSLNNLGIKKFTTHAGEDGSGIGYITIFKIINENNASIIITEHKPENYSFTKSIKIRFDGKSEFILNSYRADEIKPSVEREGMLIFEYN